MNIAKNNTSLQRRGPKLLTVKGKGIFGGKNREFLFSPKIGHSFLFQASRRLYVQLPGCPGSAASLWRGGPAPRAAPGYLRFPPTGRPRLPLAGSCSGARGLTVLSSFPVKADRAERACVDAALDILGTADASHGRPLLHGCSAPNTLLSRGSR